MFRHGEVALHLELQLCYFRFLGVVADDFLLAERAQDAPVERASATPVVEWT